MKDTGEKIVAKCGYLGLRAAPGAATAAPALAVQQQPEQHRLEVHRAAHHHHRHHHNVPVDTDGGYDDYHVDDATDDAADDDANTRGALHPRLNDLLACASVAAAATLDAAPVSCASTAP